LNVKPQTGHASEETLSGINAKLPDLVNGRLPVDVPASDGGLTDDELRASPVPVSGTFYPATQTIAGSVSIVGSVAVTGTFWQATQPVSGTFWQATQPVSVGSLPLPSGASTEATLSSLNGKVTACNTGAVTVSALPKAREDSAAMTWASAKNAAPSASAVQADTGALTAGDYDFDIFMLASDTVAVGKGLVVEHRNASNNATLQTLGGCAAQGNQTVNLRRYTIATNERIRVIAGTAAGAASSMYVSAIGRRVS